MTQISAAISVDSQRARFVERKQCVSCDGTDLQAIWQGRFNEEPVRGWMQSFRYGGDVGAALGDEKFARVSCNSCGMAFHQRVLTDEWLTTLYAQWINSAQVDAFEADHQKNKVDAKFVSGVQLFKHLLRLHHLLAGRPRRPLRLLDFGCGDGKFLGLGAALGFEAFGIDFSTSRQERAQRAGISIASNLEELMEKDASSAQGYDCVTLFEVLEHVTNPRGILDALAAVMQPQSVLLIEVPDCSGIEVPGTFAEFDAVQPLEHINHFTPETLAALCARAGFRPAPRVPAHATTSPVSVLKTEASRFLKRPMTSQYFWRS